MVLLEAKQNVKRNGHKCIFLLCWWFLDLLHSNELFVSFFEATNDDEKERYIASVIKALSNDTTLRNTAKHRILARAYVSQSKLQWSQSKDDAAMDTIANHALPLLHGNDDDLYGPAYRLQADICIERKEYASACVSLRNQLRHQPALETKIAKELQQLIAIN